MNFLQVYNIEDLQSLPSGTWGIKEPTVDFKDGTRMDGEYFSYDLYMHAVGSLSGSFG
jgi:hypothetical protein